MRWRWRRRTNHVGRVLVLNNNPPTTSEKERFTELRVKPAPAAPTTKFTTAPGRSYTAAPSDGRRASGPDKFVLASSCDAIQPKMRQTFPRVSGGTRLSPCPP